MIRIHLNLESILNFLDMSQYETLDTKVLDLSDEKSLYVK